MQLLQTSFVLAAVPSAWSDYRPLNHPFIGIVVGLQPMLARLIGHEFSRDVLSLCVLLLRYSDRYHNGLGRTVRIQDLRIRTY
jgi:hypothetical protein